MIYETIFEKLPDSEAWRYVKNKCRRTANKDNTETEATDSFKRKLLMSEHSPIRELNVAWSWNNIFYWVGMEWARHKFEKFISSQRDDRLLSKILRSRKPQDAPITFDASANMQSLIDAWRKRLCVGCVTKEANGLAQAFKYDLHKTHPIEADILVPNCIYRGGCPEFKPCGYFNKFRRYFEQKYGDAWELDFLDLQKRYDAYNELFYENFKRLPEQESSSVEDMFNTYCDAWNEEMGKADL